MAKFCPHCGNPIDEGAVFCGNCGCKLEAQPNPQPEQAPTRQYEQPELQHPQPPFSVGQQVTPNITLGGDGKYRWIYEMSLFRNPTIFLLVWKIFLIITLGIFLFAMLMDAINGYMDLERLLLDLKIIAYVFIGVTALVAISCLIYAAIMGGKYIVLFTMDEHGINHAQIPTQAKKARNIAAAAFLIGAASGSFGGMAGGLAAANTEMYTSFAKTRKVRFYPRRETIKIRQTLSHNQIYAKPEDFDFVQSYILARVPDKAKPKNMRQPN